MYVRALQPQDASILDLFISTDDLHVSGGSSAHHQEHITVHTASVIVNCNDKGKGIASKFLYIFTSNPFNSIITVDFI